MSEDKKRVRQLAVGLRAIVSDSQRRTDLASKIRAALRQLETTNEPISKETITNATEIQLRDLVKEKIQNLIEFL